MSATKIDFKRELSELYGAKATPKIVDVPELAFLMVDGHGAPGSAPEFRAAIEALYPLAYTIKFMIKAEPGGIDYRVMPLEGLFWVEGTSEFPPPDPSLWRWTAMIMQPGPVTTEVVEAARQKAADRRSSPALDRVRFERFLEGQAAQVMHIGPYADEAPTIGRLHEFIAEQGYRPTGKHHEIYLGDPTRSAPERLKTIIRQPVTSG